MNQDVRTFQFGAASRTLNGGLLWLGVFVLLLAWTYATSNEVNLAILAIIVSNVLQIGLGFTRWRNTISVGLLAFFGPLMLVGVLALVFDDRLWLKPVWILILIFFGAMTLGSLGGVTLDKTSLILRSFAIAKLQIPYSAIQSVELGNSSGGTTRIRIEYMTTDKTPAKRQTQLFQFMDDDARKFVVEVKHRAGIDESASFEAPHRGPG